MRKKKYTKEKIESSIENSRSIAECLRKLGLREAGGNYQMFKKYARFYGLTLDHFKGQAWAKGKTVHTDKSIKRTTEKISYSNAIAFSENAPPSITGGKLRKRLLKLGWKERCKRCSVTKWQNEFLRMDIDHINGIPNDNRMNNLRFLCPNCHRLTKTWGNKKRN